MESDRLKKISGHNIVYGQTEKELQGGKHAALYATGSGIPG